MSDIDDLNSKLSTSNWLNTGNLVANTVTARNTARIAAAAEEANARARTQEQRATQIQSLRNVLFDAEQKLSSFQAQVQSGDAMSQAQALEYLVITIEWQTFLNDGGALNVRNFDAIDDKRFSTNVGNLVASIINGLENRHQGIGEHLQLWNSTAGYCTRLQGFIWMTELLKKPLTPDKAATLERINKHVKWLLASIVILFFFGIYQGLGATAGAAAFLWYLWKHPVLAHGSRETIDACWYRMLPSTPLDTKMCRSELARHIKTGELEVTTVAEALAQLNQTNAWRKTMSEGGKVYTRENSSAIGTYNGDYLIPPI
jgi:hypothetical protein